MTDFVVEARNLRKVYRDLGRKIVAVDDLDLTVRRGEVHGFLGPNGSGKTTTIRMLLGLARPDKGEIVVLGQSYPAGIPQALARTGAVLEQPLFSPGLSGRRNLLLLARAVGLKKTRVDEVLEQVHLNGRRRYGSLSLGDKRRLGLAAALLKQPELLILDEPANGLDPAGIRDIRDTIARLADSGVSVLLSSHVLAEVQQICSSVSIIDEGRLLSSGRVADLLGEQVSRTRVGVGDPDRAARHLEEAGFVVTRDGEDLIVEGHEHPEEISHRLAEHGLYVAELSAIRPTLESFFLRLTGSRGPGTETPVVAEQPTETDGSVAE